MNQLMKKVMALSEAIFYAEPCVLAAWHTGSVGSQTDDDYSDVDPIFVVEDAQFRVLEKRLKELFRRISDDIVLMWPERVNNEDFYNYAVLLIYGGELLQYDFTAIRRSLLDKSPEILSGVMPEAIIFDKANILQWVHPAKEEMLCPSDLCRTIETFWLYAYISVKYFLRGDIYKAAYAREELRNAHVTVLNALTGGPIWHWWAGALSKYADARMKQEMLVYFGPREIGAMRIAFHAQCELFTRDARRASEKMGMAYPEELEYRIRKHIADKLGR